MKRSSETEFREYILILNPNGEQSAYLQELRSGISRVDSAASVEEAIRCLSEIEYDAVVVDSALADYSRLRGLFLKKTGLIITGRSEARLRRIAREWPRDHYVDVTVIRDLRENGGDLLLALDRAVSRARLLTEVTDLKRDQELNRADMGEAFHQIQHIKHVVESSVIREIEKRLDVETRLNWFRREKQHIESILKKIYLSNDITSLLDIFPDIRDLVGAAGISFYLLDKNGSTATLKPLVWGGSIPSLDEISRLAVRLDTPDIAARVVREGREINLCSPAADDLFTDRYLSLRTPLRNLLCIPIRHDKEVIGALEVFNKSGDTSSNVSFSSGDRRVLHQMCEHISIAINKLNLIQYDALTGLLRPDPFYDKMLNKLSSKKTRRAQEFGYALVIGDVDWFKHYNDRNGHEAGNRLLRTLSQTLKASIREKDLLCRYGGEEFLFFLTGIQSHEQALLFTDRIRRNVEDQSFDYQEFQPRGNLTMSFGVTCFDMARFPDPNAISLKEIKRLISEADTAMAEAKGHGTLSDPAGEAPAASDKNRTSVFQPGGGLSGEMNTDKTIREQSAADEKRKYPRYMTSLSLIYKTKEEHRVTNTLNLSLGGAKISTDHSLEYGNTLELTVILGKSAFHCKGDIIYSVQGGEGFSACFSGLKFWDLSLNDRRLLEKYISSLTVKKTRRF